jgi:glucose-6-phosphate 1-dehydrogenase
VTNQIRAYTPTLLILGASGDLAARYLLPGIGALLASGETRGFRVVGASREEWGDDRWRKCMTEAFGSVNARGPFVEAAIADATYVRADVTDAADLARLLDLPGGPLFMYFALPPGVTEAACRLLAGMELPESLRLVMEKPFGTDAASAAALNDLLARLVPDDRVFRVDHFLGMPTVMNIAGTRFTNRVFEPVLNADHVEHVDIVFDERIALEGRGDYYDATGALVDVMQSHLLQVLSIVAMEPPPSLEHRDLAGSKERVLRATRVWDDDPASFSRRARYTAGQLADGRSVPSYAEAGGVDPARQTETYADVVFAVDTWRWAGVPFRLRTGKAIAPERMEIVITFRQPQRLPAGFTGRSRSNRLRISLGAGHLALDLNVNSPGDPADIDLATLEAPIGAGALPAYGEVLKGIMQGSRAHSVSGEAAVESWRIVEPVLRAWRSGDVPLEEYVAGSAGPEGWPPLGPPT